MQLLDTQNFFALLNLPYPTTQESVIASLLSERLIASESDGFAIRNMGAVLLAKRLRDFATVFCKAPRVIAYDGVSKAQAISDTSIEKGYAVGFQDVVDYIMTQLPQKEVIENALRKERKLLPEIVIRELVANALIHQDFEISGTSPMIEIYSDRVEISNPGTPLVPTDRFIDGYRSRNERLTDLMRRFRICEKRSSGVDYAVRAVEEERLPTPDFQVGFDRTIAVIFGLRSFAKMNRAERIRACYQHCVLQWVERKPMTNQSLRERFGLAANSTSNISQIIATTVAQGDLIKANPKAETASRKYASYIPHWA